VLEALVAFGDNPFHLYGSFVCDIIVPNILCYQNVLLQVAIVAVVAWKTRAAMLSDGTWYRRIGIGVRIGGIGMRALPCPQVKFAQI
jgi:hypothetical protein